MVDDQQRTFRIDEDKLPDAYPTHLHEPEFWQSLGRAVATFGFLEEVLARAIFALTATRSYAEAEIEAENKRWVAKLEKTLSDQLGGLIDTYGKALREHPRSKLDGFKELIGDLRKASKIRNVICHGSWGTPDETGASLPLFVNRQLERFDTRVDHSFLNQLQKQTKSLACAVINTVTAMGFQFPGSSGQGKVIWKTKT